MSEEKKRVNAVIDLDLYVRITEAGYGISEAVTKGFEKLLEEPREDLHANTLESTENLSVSTEIEELKVRIEDYKAQIQTLKLEITRLQNVIMEAPDPMELVKIQERNEGLNLLIDEKNKRIDDLTREVERLDIFAHYFKNVDIKQLEAPAEQKVKKSFFTRVKEVFIPG